MKRIILLIAFILSFSLVGMSQSSGTYTAKKVNTKTVKIKHKYTPQFEKGWNLCPEIGVSMGTSLNLDVLFSAGYQINPYILIGMGTGIYSFQSDDNYWYDTKDFFYSISFPLFITCKINFLTTRHGFTPFYEAKVGYTFGLWGDSYYDYEYDHTSDYFPDCKYFYGQQKSQGFYGYSGVGLDWHNFNLLFSWHFFNIKSKGRNIRNYWDGIDYENVDSFYLRPSVSFSLAYNIPLKKKSQAHRQLQKVTK